MKPDKTSPELDTDDGCAAQRPADDLVRVQQRAIQSITNGILISDATESDTPVVYCNPAFEQMSGYSEHEVLGRSFLFLERDDLEQESLKELHSAIKEGRKCKIVLRNYRKDGTQFWNELTISPIFDDQGSLTHILGIHDDISERIKIQQELEREKGLFEGLVRGVPDALMLANLDRELTFCNPGATQVFGYESDELVGQPAAVLYDDPVEHEKQGRVRFRADADQVFAPVEVTMKRKSGERFPAEMVGTILKTVNQEPIGFLGLIRDISSRKESEAAQQRHYRVLEALSTGRKLDDLLKLVVQLAEEARPGMLGSILLLDETKTHLRNGYAASLPDSYNRAINGIKIGLGVGSCGTAAFEGHRVIVEDIVTHPFWKDYHELATSEGLRACWSQPIMSSDDEILGTLAMYFREPQTPSKADLQLLHQSAQLAGIVVDRARTNDRVLKSEERYRSLVQASSSTVWTTSPDGHFDSRQIAWEKYTGQPWKQHRDDGWTKMLHPEDRERIRTCWMESVKKGTRFDVQGRLWHAESKTYRYFEAQAVAIRNEEGQVIEWVGTTTDVHERVAAYRALRTNEERLSLAFSATNDAIWDFDLTNGTVWWNEAYHKQFGRSKETADSWKWWSDRIHPADRDRVGLSLLAFCKGSGTRNRWVEEYRFRRADGTYAYIVERALRAFNESGRPVRVLGAILDVTDRRTLEKEVLESESETQRAIGHDLHDGVGQELTGLAMLADSLTTALRRKSIPESQLAEKIGVGIERTLEQVRTLARGMNPVIVDPQGLTSALVELTEHAQQLYGTQCQLTCPETQLIDDSETATQLFRIAQEAITNAVKHGKATRINVELAQTADSIALRIVDNGTGVMNNADKKKGTGMRSMQYRADVIGGKLSVVSKENEGTTVACILPARPAMSAISKLDDVTFE